MTPDELVAELGSRSVRPAYLVAGPEPLLREESLAALRRAVLDGAVADFDLDRFEGDSVSPGALRDALRMLPAVAPRRLVWVREPTGGRGAWRAVCEALPGLLQELGDATTTTLVVSATSLDRRTTWVRAFGDALVVCEAPRHARELAAFVRRDAKRLGIPLESGAAEALVERVGPSLLGLRAELEKAALLAAPGEPLARRHVVALVADLAEEPVWDLTDAIGEGRVGDAIQLLARLTAAGAAAPMLLGTLAAHFRKLLRLRSGGSVPGPPFVRRKLEAQAGRFATGRLLACLRAIHETDEALKGQGALPAPLAMERLVLGLAS